MPTHEDMIEQGTRKYIEFLRSSRHLRQGAALAALESLIESLDNALAHRTNLQTHHLTFTADTLAGLTTPEKREFHNPYLAGYGNPRAKVILVGTEHAFQFDRLRPKGPTPDACFSLADCLLPALWLADGSPITATLASHVCKMAPHCLKGHAAHRHPYEFLLPVPSGQMWRRLSRLLAAAGLARHRCAVTMWGHDAYMFELSESAAAAQPGGALPSEERIAFLGTILGSLEDARVLVFHGQWNNPAWDYIRHNLCTQFLQTNAAPNYGAPWQTGLTQDFRWLTNNDRIAIIMQSPTRFGPVNDFLDGVGEQIKPFV